MTCLVASKVETLREPRAFAGGTGERADAHQPESGTPINPRYFMTNEELDHLARCEDAMKQARWAIALQLSRWRDGDSVCAVGELQNAYDALADLVGDAKPIERTNLAQLKPNAFSPSHKAFALCQTLLSAKRTCAEEMAVIDSTPETVVGSALREAMAIYHMVGELCHALIEAHEATRDDDGKWVDRNGDYVPALNGEPLPGRIRDNDLFAEIARGNPPQANQIWGDEPTNLP